MLCRVVAHMNSFFTFIYEADEENMDSPDSIGYTCLPAPKQQKPAKE